MSYVVAAFYKFVSLPDFADRQAPLLAVCQAAGVKGTILLAAEGINSTIAGTREGMDRVLEYLRSDAQLTDLVVKESVAQKMPFARLKVRLKREIVTLGQPQADPSQQVGTYVKPQDWNALISNPDVLVIDTRNDFEVSIGTFAGAENPQTESFREFPDYVAEHCDRAQHKKVAMFCTGGIRCEKASSYMLSQGFEAVYHLEGGILNYLEEVPAEESLWEGECYVFDQRVAVTHGLAQGSYGACPSCGHPISPEDQESAKYEEGISCPHCFNDLTDDQRERFTERQKQRVLQRHQSSI
jgi:UPF0176 protein